MSFGDRVKSYRVNIGVTQGELADRSGLTLGQISKIERGIGNPTLETIEKVIKGLGCHASDLFEGANGNLSEYLKELFSRTNYLCRQDQETIINVTRAIVSAQNVRAAINENGHWEKEDIEEAYLDHLERESKKNDPNRYS